jgi:hypothetical protein
VRVDQSTRSEGRSGHVQQHGYIRGRIVRWSRGLLASRARAKNSFPYLATAHKLDSRSPKEVSYQYACGEW